MFLTKLLSALRRRRRDREVNRMLHGLSDRALSDMGLDRSGIADVVWHGRSGPAASD